ncbi:MAG: esterase family protein, partial [Clostridia bacterium]|nr:esterase family protein [Clostridia bacterium]
MAHLTLDLYSDALHKATQVEVIMPQYREKNENSGPYRCLYLLHGASENHLAWMRRTSIERYAAKYNLAVIMPDGGRSYYTNTRHGDRYYDYVALELPEIIDRMFPVSRERKDNFISGMSMGGYGALKIGLSRSDRFSAIAAFSSVADIVDFASGPNGKLARVFGPEGLVYDEDDLFHLADICPQRPRIYLSTGDCDRHTPANRKLSRHLHELGYD